MSLIFHCTIIFFIKCELLSCDGSLVGSFVGTFVARQAGVRLFDSHQVCRLPDAPLVFAYKSSHRFSSACFSSHAPWGTFDILPDIWFRIVGLGECDDLVQKYIFPIIDSFIIFCQFIPEINAMQFDFFCDAIFFAHFSCRYGLPCW